MTRPVVTRLAVMGLVAVLASASLAQGRRPQRLEGTYRTSSSGTVTMRGNTDNVRGAVLDLNRDGTFDLRITADSTITVEGRWDDVTATEARFTILEINNRKANGTGMASIGRGNQLDLLNLNGNANGSRFNLLLRSRNTERGNDRIDWEDARRGRTESLNATRSGNGNIRYNRGGDDRINEVAVTLERDGDARIRIEGEEDFSFSGRWRGDRSNRVTLDLDQSFGRRADSDGWLVMDGRGGFTELHITGRNPILNQTFRLNFNTNGRGEGRDDDWNDSSSRRAAGTYTFVDRFTERGDRDSIRYTLRLERDGKAELVAQTNEDLPRDRNSIEEHGEILHRLDGRNQGRHIGTWSSDGNRVTIRLTSFRYGSRSEGEESTFRGTLMNNGDDLRIDEWDRAFYGRDNRFWFDKN